MIFIKHDHIYLLKKQTFDPTWLKDQAHQMGYQLIEVDDVQEFIEIVKSLEIKSLESTDTTPKPKEAHLFIQNLRKDSEKKYLSQLFDQMQWIIKIMNEMHIGLMISDGIHPFMMNEKAREILQQDPGQIETHPICESVVEDQQAFFSKAIRQLVNREIVDYTEEIQIQTPAAEEKNIHIHGKPLDMKNFPLIVEYMEEKKQTSHAAIIKELHRIVAGLSSIIAHRYNQKENQNPQLEQKRKPGSRYNLTRRETQILQFIYQGYTSQQIAEKLYISKRTVESHRANILHKTSSKNTADLIRFAVRNKLL